MPIFIGADIYAYIKKAQRYFKNEMDEQKFVSYNDEKLAANGKEPGMTDHKFGMFIHWGIYAVLGLHEQVLARYNYDKHAYEQLMDCFNPTSYNPEDWVLLAKHAGMKYICFTAKHHNGFCMWDTKYTDYKITNTPYQKDVLKELQLACRKHGMLFSIYYSNPDWHHADAYNPKSSHQWCAVKNPNTDFKRYKEYIKAQLTELLTNYGEIYTLFWDIPPQMQDESINALARKLQPDILINDRGFDTGDFSTSERDYDTAGFSGRFHEMTEACNAVGEQSWGYRKTEDYHSIRYLTHSIDKIMAFGGSYLLNIGPDAEGKIPEKARQSIENVGNWYNRVKHTLEFCQADTFDYGNMKYSCARTKKDNKTYFHFYDGMNASGVAIKQFPNIPQAVVFVNTGKSLPFCVEYMPEFLNPDDEKTKQMYLHIFDIPVDDYEKEPIIIEVTW